MKKTSRARVIYKTFPLRLTKPEYLDLQAAAKKAGMDTVRAYIMSLIPKRPQPATEHA